MGLGDEQGNLRIVGCGEISISWTNVSSLCARAESSLDSILQEVGYVSKIYNKDSS